MRYQPKRKKKPNTFLLYLHLLIIALVIYILAINDPDKQPVRPLQADSEYRTLEYEISNIEGNDYYGEGSNGTGIYFTSKNLDENTVKEITEGSRILAYFEKENHIDGLVKIEVIDK